ncbi:MAG: hypothetical protein Q4A54_09315 [Parabacteroides sp.]|nr:hypothetical protein [Parabacteroides sp.]
MERIKNLNLYQKGVLVFMIIISLIFSVVYSRTISKVGFEYKDTILVPSQDNGSTMYSGKIQGQQALFIMSEDKTVVFHYGDKTYGPYTVKEDSTAIPKDEEFREEMTGVELYNGEKLLFRGGILKFGDNTMLYNEDGTVESFGISYVTSYGVELDENGNEIDPIEPSASDILDLMNNPKLTHKGEWLTWLEGVFICVLNALSILFADELFRWNLAFQIRDAEKAEPSDWEIAGRYIGWTVLPIMALVLFIVGLR